MATPATVTALTGHAWIRNSDGSRIELHVGSKIPPGAHIETDPNSSLQLLVDGSSQPITLGGDRTVAYSGEMSGGVQDTGENAAQALQGTDSDRLLAALQNGQDIFQNLDATAAVAGAGGAGADGGSTFVVLDRLALGTSPLGLAYPNESPATPFTQGGDPAVAQNTPVIPPPAAVNTPPVANNDTNGTGASDDTNGVKEDVKLVATGNVLANDVDPDGDPLTVTTTGTQNGAYGSVVINADGSYTYTLHNTDPAVQGLAEGQKVTDVFTYAVDDGRGGTATATLTIVIEGTNDAPVINEGGDTGAVKEAGVVMANGEGNTPEPGTPSASGQLTATDPDAGATQAWSLVGGGAGTYGTFSVDANGKWTYNLDNTDPDTNHLAQGQQATETFTVQVSDGQGGTDTRDVTITVTGTNDIPVITTAAGQDAGAVVEDKAGQTTTGGQLSSSDVDAGATASWGLSDATNAYGAFTLDAATGKWTYTLDHDKANGLAAGETRTETFTATVTDEFGAHASEVVTVTITGTNDAPVISEGGDTGAVKEAGVVMANGEGNTPEPGTPSASGQLTATDPDAGATQAWSLVGSGAGTYGTFSVDANGKWTYNLDNADPDTNHLAQGQQATETFTVQVSDGQGGTDTRDVTITVTGTNDIPVITTAAGQEAGAVVEDKAGETTTGGQLSSSDVDAGATASWSLSDATNAYGAFTLDTTTGKWTYTLDHDKANGLAAGETRTETFTATVTDEFGAHASEVVTVTITGTNDAPVMTLGTPPASVYESGLADGTAAGVAAITTTGSFTVGDADGLGDIKSITVAGVTFTIGTGAGQYASLDAIAAAHASATTGHGTVTITGYSNGTFTYEYDLTSPVHNPTAASASATDTFAVTVTDKSNASDSQNITVTIVDDAPKVATIADHAYLVNQAGSTVSGLPLDIDGNIHNNAGADQPGALTFSAASGSVYQGATANGQPIYLYVSSDGQTLIGSTTAGSSYSAVSADASHQVFTVQLNESGAPGSDAYSFTLHQAIDGGATSFNVLNGYAAPQGGNTAYAAYIDPNPNDADGDQDVLISPIGGGSVNSSSWSWGVASAQSIGSGEGLRVDFVHGLVSNGSSYAYDGHNTVNDAVASFVKTGGSTIQIHAANDTDGTVGGGAGVDITMVRISYNGQSVMVDLSTYHTGDTVTVGGHNFTLAEVGNDVQIGGVVGGTDVSSATQVEIFTDAGYTTLEYTWVSGDTFKVGGFGASVETQGETQDLSFGLTLSDSDGDSLSIPDGISVTLAPDGYTTYTGTAGNDDITVVSGKQGLVLGGDGNDTLHGSTGDDILVGGRGDDTMWGGGGHDTFAFNLADKGTDAAPAVDTIKDFDKSSDVLDLSDLLKNADQGDLGKYLQASVEGGDSHVVLKVSTEGNLGSGGSGAFDQKIVLEGVHLSDLGAANASEIIAKLADHLKT